MTISFLPKGSTVNADNYCELLETVRGDIRYKRRGLLATAVILLQDNARPYTAARTLAKIDRMGWELLKNPQYRPDILHYYLFGPLKEYVRGKHFKTDEEVM